MITFDDVLEIFEITLVYELDSGIDLSKSKLVALEKLYNMVSENEKIILNRGYHEIVERFTGSK